MCIFFVSTDHWKYRLIALSNRDEMFNRPTAPASWHDLIFSPVDLSTQERGTWIALSKKGKLAVLLNVQEPSVRKEPISRGVFALEYVTNSSNQTCQTWFKSIEDQTRHSGGFNLICVDITHNMLYVVTNRGPQNYQEIQHGTHCFSNALLGHEWTKTSIGEDLFRRLIEEDCLNHSDEPAFIDECFTLLSKNDLNAEDIESPTSETFQKSIFIPPVYESDTILYGTRTQTVVLIDNEGQVIYTERNALTREMKEHRFTIDLE